MRTPKDILKRDFPSLWSKLDILELDNEVIYAMRKYASQFGHRIKSDGSEIKILDIVSKYLNIPIEKIIAKVDNKEVNEARHIAIFCVKKHTVLPIKLIGEFFERNHATVLHSCKVVCNLCDTDKVFEKKVIEIEKLISII
jgi:chromosomal replication initiator protein